MLVFRGISALWTHDFLDTSLVASLHVRSMVKRREKRLGSVLASWLLTADEQHILPFLKYGTTETLQTLLIGSAFAIHGSILEPAGTVFAQHGGSFWHLLTEATPAAPCYQNFATYTKYMYVVTLLANAVQIHTSSPGEGVHSLCLLYRAMLLTEGLLLSWC